MLEPISYPVGTEFGSTTILFPLGGEMLVSKTPRPIGVKFPVFQIGHPLGSQLKHTDPDKFGRIV